MALLVQKFGGSSVGSVDMIKRVAQRVVDSVRSGDSVVVVVSAMADTTDEMVTLAEKITSDAPDREMALLLSSGERITTALLAMAITNLGTPAVGYTGQQAGFKTTSGRHTNSRVAEIDSTRIIGELDVGKVVVVCGFQGVDENQDETVLGRGGSDLSAVALAWALKADSCEIFTDVEGVYTADPRVVPEARKIGKISPDEMLELASAGARVLYSRSVEFAKKHGVVIHCRSTFSKETGTLIQEDAAMMEAVLVRGIAHDTDQAKITIRGVPDKPGVAARIFGRMGDASINVDMIVQNTSADGVTDMSFTVPRSELKKVMAYAEPLKAEIEAREVIEDADMAKVSVVGVGMKSHSGVASTMFSALADNGINIEMISTSEIKISCVIHRDLAEEAVRVLHRAFELDAD